MTTLSETAIIDNIRQRRTCTATIDSGAFSLKIERYQPAVSTAIHNGANLRQELAANCLLSKNERYYEEDPFTGSFIASQPITLICHDSRYEYDLNRSVEESVYETAWGKEVWKTPLTPEEIAASKAKHAQFYRVVSALLDTLVEDFGQCIVYDIHSYNYRRYERDDLPVFNLGTSTVRDEKWRPVIEQWLAQLGSIVVDGIDISVAENDIFLGKGCLARHCHSRYDNVLVLATELKKVFMNELTGEADEQVLPAIQTQFSAAVTANTDAYIRGIHNSGS